MGLSGLPIHSSKVEHTPYRTLWLSGSLCTCTWPRLRYGPAARSQPACMLNIEGHFERPTIDAVAWKEAGCRRRAFSPHRVHVLHWNEWGLYGRLSPKTNQVFCRWLTTARKPLIQTARQVSTILSCQQGILLPAAESSGRQALLVSFLVCCPPISSLMHDGRAKPVQRGRHSQELHDTRFSGRPVTAPRSTIILATGHHPTVRYQYGEPRSQPLSFSLGREEDAACPKCFSFRPPSIRFPVLAGRDEYYRPPGLA